MKTRPSKKTWIDRVKQHNILGFCLAILVLTGGCGTETGNPIVSRPKTPRLIAQDTTEAELQELSDSILEGGSSTPVPPQPVAGSSLTAFALSEGEPDSHSFLSFDRPLELTDSKQCSGDKNRIRASIQKSFQKQKRFSRLGAATLLSVERNFEINWESPLGALACTADNEVRTRVRLLEGTTETRRGSSKRTLTRTRTGTQTPGGYNSAEFTSSGTRSMRFAQVQVSTGSATVEKSIEWNINRTSRLTSNEGESSDESSSVVSPTNPIKLRIEKTSDESETVKTKTIQSGTVVTTRVDGSRVELTFENILFSSANDCYPSGGLLRGKITTAGPQEESFSIDFSKQDTDTPELVFSDGNRISLSGMCLI